MISKTELVKYWVERSSTMNGLKTASGSSEFPLDYSFQNFINHFPEHESLEKKLTQLCALLEFTDTKTNEQDQQIRELKEGFKAIKAIGSTTDTALVNRVAELFAQFQSSALDAIEASDDASCYLNLAYPEQPAKYFTHTWNVGKHLGRQLNIGGRNYNGEEAYYHETKIRLMSQKIAQFGSDPSFASAFQNELFMMMIIKALEISDFEIEQVKTFLIKEGATIEKTLQEMSKTLQTAELDPLDAAKQMSKQLLIPGNVIDSTKLSNETKIRLKDKLKLNTLYKATNDYLGEGMMIYEDVEAAMFAAEKAKYEQFPELMAVLFSLPDHIKLVENAGFGDSKWGIASQKDGKKGGNKLGGNLELLRQDFKERYKPLYCALAKNRQDSEQSKKLTIDFEHLGMLYYYQEKKKSVEHVLSDFRHKITKIGEHDKDAKEISEELFHQLTTLKEVTFTFDCDDNRMDAFIKQVESLVTNAKPVLQNDLGWGHYLDNLFEIITNPELRTVSSGSSQSFFAVKPLSAVTKVDTLEECFKSSPM